MVEWMQPLELKNIFMVLFAGTPDIFIALALIVISAMAAFFRMTVTTMFFMLALFILLFSEVSTPPILVLFSIIGGLVVGIVLSKMTNF